MKLYGLIGYPLGHSFSKKYFNNKFEMEGLEDCYFELFPIDSINQFPALIHQEKDLCGLAVTIPYKESVLTFLNTISPEAKEIGAVNCIRIENDELHGFNTDVYGFEYSLLPVLQNKQYKAIVLGTGGSSKAVQYVLKKLQIPFILVSRYSEKGRLIYEDLNAALMKEYNIIINCTPVGMSPGENEMPQIPYKYLSSDHILFDLVYQPAETRFLQMGAKQGAIVKNGFEMLELQAEENWKIWNSF